MSLIRFLKTGRSWASGETLKTRYRLPKGPMFPVFSKPSNPFTSSQESSKPAGPFSPQSSPFVGLVPARLRVAGILKDAQAVTGRLFRYARHRIVRLGVWLARMAKAVRPPRLAWKRRVEVATSSSTPLQGELSLENVRVVRSDLDDSDYDVICARTATASQVARGHSPALGSQGRPGLTQLAEKLFGSKTM